MALKADRNVVSMWWFFFVPLLEAIPLLGTIFMLIWAFSGENWSRQNYCRARLLGQLIGISIICAVVWNGLFPEVMKAAGYRPIEHPHRPYGVKGANG